MLHSKPIKFEDQKKQSYKKKTLATYLECLMTLYVLFVLLVSHSVNKHNLPINTKCVTTIIA